MEICVCADWTESTDPILVGTLRSSEIRDKEHFSFSYGSKRLASDYVGQIDPSLKLFVGEQQAQRDKTTRG
jgi:serine/threonine-protein kinase HipA